MTTRERIRLPRHPGAAAAIVGDEVDPLHAQAVALADDLEADLIRRAREVRP